MSIDFSAALAFFGGAAEQSNQIFAEARDKQNRIDLMNAELEAKAKFQSRQTNKRRREKAEKDAREVINYFKGHGFDSTEAAFMAAQGTLFVNDRVDDIKEARKNPDINVSDIVSYKYKLLQLGETREDSDSPFTISESIGVGLVDDVFDVSAQPMGYQLELNQEQFKMIYGTPDKQAVSLSMQLADVADRIYEANKVGDTDKVKELEKQRENILANVILEERAIQEGRTGNGQTVKSLDIKFSKVTSDIFELEMLKQDGDPNFSQEDLNRLYLKSDSLLEAKRQASDATRKSEDDSKFVFTSGFLNQISSPIFKRYYDLFNIRYEDVAGKITAELEGRQRQNGEILLLTADALENTYKTILDQEGSNAADILKAHIKTLRDDAQRTWKKEIFKVVNNPNIENYLKTAFNSTDEIILTNTAYPNVTFMSVKNMFKKENITWDSTVDEGGNTIGYIKTETNDEGVTTTQKLSTDDINRIIKKQRDELLNTIDPYDVIILQMKDIFTEATESFGKLKGSLKVGIDLKKDGSNDSYLYSFAESPEAVTSEAVTEAVTSEPLAVTSEPPEAVTSEPPEAVTSEPLAVTSEPPAVTSEPPEAVTSEAVTSEAVTSETVTYANGDEFVGEFKDGKRHGQGTYTFGPDSEWAGDKYEGEWKDGKRNGQGTYISADGREYVGEFKDNKRNGMFTVTYASGSKFVGEYKDGKRNGQGTFTWADGDKFVGEFKDGKKNGQGTYNFVSGAKFVGEFKDDKKNGQGTYISADGTKKEGIWKDDEFLGTGKQ